MDVAHELLQVHATNAGLTRSKPARGGAGSDYLPPGSIEVTVQRTVDRSYGMLFGTAELRVVQNIMFPPLMGLSVIWRRMRKVNTEFRTNIGIPYKGACLNRALSYS